MTTFYTKNVSKNGKVSYHPVREYDPDLTDALPYGTHLIIVDKNVQSRRYNIDPDYATLIAAAINCKDILLDTLAENNTATLSKLPYTQKQLDLWEELKNSLEVDYLSMTKPSWNEQAESLVDKLIEQSKILLQKPAVQKAHANFQLICKLSKDYNQTTI